jgi:serine/threonine protein kinase
MVLVFLTNPDSTEFPKYPICKVSTIVTLSILQSEANVIPKIGDFGSARITYKTDAKNPSFWYDPLTPGYVAPEIDHDNTYKLKAWEMSNATNVSCVCQAWERPVYISLQADV